jgi:hypothetical protein
VFVSGRLAIIDDGEEGRKIGWNVYGQGDVTIYRNGLPRVFRSGEHFVDDFRA